MRLYSAFTTPELFGFFGAERLEYVVVIGGSRARRYRAERAMGAVRGSSTRTELTEHSYRDYQYSSEGWGCVRQVVIKAEVVRSFRERSIESAAQVESGARQIVLHLSQSASCRGSTGTG